MKIDSLLRRAENQALAKITLTGKVLDLGGDKNSDYQALLGGQFELTTVNGNPQARPDLIADLEETLPLAAESFEGVLLVNVLEHIFNWENLLRESYRVLKPGGDLVVIVPFLFPIHPSPYDFWRFSAQALERKLKALGFSQLSIKPLGGGVFSACFLLLDRLLPTPCRLVNSGLVPFVLLLDKAWSFFARRLGKNYQTADYPLGYLATAQK